MLLVFYIEMLHLLDMYSHVLCISNTTYKISCHELYANLQCFSPTTGPNACQNFSLLI
jgi:hypothetical protein